LCSSRRVDQRQLDSEAAGLSRKHTACRCRLVYRCSVSSLHPTPKPDYPITDAMSSPLDPPHQTANVPEDMTGRPRRVATGGISLRKTFSALKHRNFRLFFSGQLISFTGTWMTTTAQGWLVYQLTGSKALLGLVAAAASAPMLFFATWGGWVADRYPKRSVIVVTQTCSMILSLTMAALVWNKLVQPWHIIVLGILGVTPISFFGFLGLLAWSLIVSALLYARGGRSHATPAGAPGAVGNAGP